MSFIDINFWDKILFLLDKIGFIFFIFILSSQFVKEEFIPFSFLFKILFLFFFSIEVFLCVKKFELLLIFIIFLVVL